MNIIVKSIPNTITCLNLLSGCVAIALSFRPEEVVCAGLYGWQWAVIFIFAAAVFDFLDGLAARVLHAYSDIGKELDSLSDLVSFGVAPAMLLLNIMIYFNGHSWWYYFVFLIPMLGGLRLARFNVRDTQGDNSYFHGLPIPANALFWIGYVAWIWRYGMPEFYVVAIGIVLVSLAMVSNLLLPSLKFKNMRLKGNIARYFIIIVSVALVCIFGLPGFTWAILVYLIMGVFNRSSEVSS